jgi:transcriptional regulator with XRE-family HTH domain
MVTKRIPKLSDQLRHALDECGISRYRIAQDTGINESALAQFYLGKRGLELATLDKLAEYLEITINVGRKPSKQGKR